MNPQPGPDWFPSRIRRVDNRWIVDWLRLGEHRFTDPFFEETVRRCERDARLSGDCPQTDLDDLPEEGPNALAPSGLIFHLSRCGSTLVSQSFAASDATVAISEAAPVDDVLRAADAGDAWRIGRLRAIAGAIGRRRRPAERRCIVKFDAWHALDIPIVERAFPGVPWLFIYRDPVEVMVSHERTPSRFMLPVNGQSLFGIGLAEALTMPPEDYRARVLARVCDAVAALDPAPERLISYAELPGAIEGRIAPAFGIELGTAGRTAARVDAKHPQRAFVADGEEKRRNASPAIRAAVERFVAAPYARLEALRAGSQDNSHPAAVSSP